MRYIAEDATLRFKFTTRRFSTGAPYTLAGTPSLAVYPEDSTTQVTGGITLTVDYDSVTGLNDVVIDLSASASYAAGKAYQVTIEAGTVDSVSVVGEVIYEFYIHASGGLEALITRGLLALPAVAPDGAGGLIISDAGGLDADAIASELAKVPKSDGTASWNATAAAQIQSEAGDALTAYGPAIPGAQMDLVNAPNATAVAAIQSGLSTYDGSDTSGTTTLLSRLSAARAGYLDNLSAGAVATAAKLLAYFQLLFRSDSAIETDNATELTAINADGGSGAGNYSAQTDSVEALRDRGDAAWTTATGFSTLDAAGVRSAIGLATANLDTQLGDIPTNSELTTALSSLSTLDAAGVRAAIGMASADMDTQLDAILAVATIIRKLKTGNIIDKPGGGSGEYQVLDDDDTTAYANVTLSESSPQQQVTLL